MQSQRFNLVFKMHEEYFSLTFDSFEFIHIMLDKQPLPPYIHGYSPSEPSRLVDQAAILAPAVFNGLNLGSARSLLEIGCGTGAQTRHLLQHWPCLTIHAIDQNPLHLASAAAYLQTEVSTGRVNLTQANAEDLPFEGDRFDAAITIWVLEHALRPKRILSEIMRVLRPGGRIFLHEVDNSTFGFTPDNRIISHWWECYNDFQKKAGADPFIGERLETLARRAGFINIRKDPLYVVSSNREPERRLTLLRYLRDLLLSGAESLKRSSEITDQDVKDLKREFSRLEIQPEVDFEYSAVRLVAEKPGI